MSTMSLTGLFYLRNNKGDLLIDPTSGLPVRSPSLFIDRGYDERRPDAPDHVVGSLAEAAQVLIESAPAVR